MLTGSVLRFFNGGMDIETMKPYSAEQLKMIVENVFHTLDGCRYDISIDVNGGAIPHEKPTPKMLGDYEAVYLFYCPSEKQYLKIGRVGAGNVSRFCYQHYSIQKGIGSSLPKLLLNDQEMTSKYNLTRDKIGNWILDHTIRYNIIIKHRDNPFSLELIESVMHYLCHPRYEG